MFKRVLEVRTWRFCGCELVNFVNLINLGWLGEPGLTFLFGTACVGGSASLFIDEGDDFTSERERVRMLLSLVAHTDGYKMMVGVYNTHYWNPSVFLGPKTLGKDIDTLGKMVSLGWFLGIFA